MGYNLEAVVAIKVGFGVVNARSQASHAYMSGSPSVYLIFHQSSKRRNWRIRFNFVA